MVDAISGGGDVAAYSAVQAQQSVQSEASVAVLKKAMDTQSSALLQLMQSLGVGNNINALA